MCDPGSKEAFQEIQMLADGMEFWELRRVVFIEKEKGADFQ